MLKPLPALGLLYMCSEACCRPCVPPSREFRAWSLFAYIPLTRDPRNPLLKHNLRHGPVPESFACLKASKIRGRRRRRRRRRVKEKEQIRWNKLHAKDRGTFEGDTTSKKRAMYGQQLSSRSFRQEGEQQKSGMQRNGCEGREVRAHSTAAKRRLPVPPATPHPSAQNQIEQRKERDKGRRIEAGTPGGDIEPHFLA